MEKKKTKLKKMKLTSVDMVRRGANQDAYINLYKSDAPADGPEAPDLTEIPQPLWKSIVDLVKGFMGHQESQEDNPDDIEKAESFQDRVTLAEISDNRWRFQDALNMSIDSIIRDEDLEEEEKKRLIDESIDQFAQAYKDMCAKMLTASKNTVTPTPKEPAYTLSKNIPEGEEEMKIDKSRFTAEELAQYEALIAKGLVDEEPVKKAEEEPPKKEPEKKVDPEKAEEELHPEVKKALAEIEELKKGIEMDQMKSIAKKYAPLGKKENELAETLYEMKKSSDKSYGEYIKVLDEQLGLVEKSGMFEEIGKSGRGLAGGSTVDKIEGIASDIQKSDPTLSRQQAVMKAWEQHPELIAEYDSAYAGGR